MDRWISFLVARLSYSWPKCASSKWEERQQLLTAAIAWNIHADLQTGNVSPPLFAICFDDSWYFTIIVIRSFVARVRRAGWTVGSCEISSGAFQINRCLLLCIATFMLSCSLSISLSRYLLVQHNYVEILLVQCAPSYVPIWMKRIVGRKKNMQIKRKSVWLEICIYFQMLSSHIHRLICMFPTHDKS